MAIMNMNPSENSTESSELSFSSLGLRAPLINSLVSLGYHSMTPIQRISLPIMLKNQDVLAQAKTGSGKTAAFGLSLLNRLQVDNYRVQALVLCPTRELAEQVAQAMRQLARLMHNVKVLNLSGGMPIKPQIDSLRHGAHIIVGTPGRVKKHLDNGSLSLRNLQTLVLDEADRMLDMGFVEAIREIIMLCPKQRQTLLFSATWPVIIKKLAVEFMHNPQRVTANETHTELDIEQVFYKVDQQKNKLSLLKTILLHHKPVSTLIFCNTKEQTAQLVAALSKEKFSAIALNGDMEQVERDNAVIRFKNLSCSVLVATDVAARGLDISHLPLVINFDLAFDHDMHIHRIGRTGRAGNKGRALSLITPVDEERLNVIEDGLKHTVRWGDVGELKSKAIGRLLPEMVTLCLSAGRKDKIRPGDILGALTKDAGLPGNMIGKIDIAPMYSYVAVAQTQAESAYQYFRNGKLKGHRVNVRRLG